MSERSERLKEARLKAGYATGSDAARAYGWPISTYLGHENGDRNFSYATAQKYAHAFSVDVMWILDGKESELDRIYFGNPRHVDVPLIGLVGQGGYVEPRINEIYGNASVVIRLPLFTVHHLVAVEIIGDFKPRHDVGDIVIFRTGYDDPEPFLTKYCLIETNDGRWYFRELRAQDNRDLYNLIAPNAPEVRDVGISQIGSIYMILPAAQVGPPHGFLERVRTFGDPREPETLIGPKLRNMR